MRQLAWYEFFAGGGMARLGLGPGWHCLCSNEWSDSKAAAYRAHFGTSDELRVMDVGKLKPRDLPGHADLVWGSFPCQDLSLAGMGAGLKGDRSGTFWPFWKLMRGVIAEGRKPSVVVLENVIGMLTSHRGRDFQDIARAVSDDGYRLGALVVDAAHFLPQSRPRLFVIAVDATLSIPRSIESNRDSLPFHSRALVSAHAMLPQDLAERWVWWKLPQPKAKPPALEALIEVRPMGVKWHTREQTAALLDMMSELNRRKVQQAIKTGFPSIGMVYKRTRPDAKRGKVQRAEVRFDGIAGCLRTPAGGSSRQTVLLIEGRKVRSRLLSPREAARLMGVPDSYEVPANYNEAYRLFGDGVAVPVVGWLEQHLLRPLAQSNKRLAVVA